MLVLLYFAFLQTTEGEPPPPVASQSSHPPGGQQEEEELQRGDKEESHADDSLDTYVHMYYVYTLYNITHCVMILHASKSVEIE